jgi:ABC-type lipopolysaccharide export system ATPase subunit
MDVIGLLGMPGAGKTTALESLTGRVDKDFKALKMKDVATEQYWGVDEHGLDYFPDEMQSKITTEGIVFVYLGAQKYGQTPDQT